MSIKNIRYSFVFLFFLLFNVKTSAWQEYIESFHSDIFVCRDSSLDITETIVYVNKSKKIHGIYRDFPTHYGMYLIFSHIVGFKLLKVLKNGEPEPFNMGDVESGKRVLVGSRNVYLSPGKYVYKIRYKTDKQLKFFSTFDELHWNVNGTLWKMPIGKVSARVYLPKGVAKENISLTAYTGKWGQKGKDYTAEFDTAGHPVFFTTRSFHPRENLTIVVNWPKGFVKEVTDVEQFWNFLKDNYWLLIALLVFLLFLIFSLWHYIAFRRSQVVGTIIPLFYPPEGLTPADIRYVDKCGYDSKVFAAEIVDMAVKGLLTIKNEPGFIWRDVYTITKNEENEDKVEEHTYKKLFYDLFKNGNTNVVLDRSNRLLIRSAVDGLKGQLKKKFKKKYFSSRTMYVLKSIPFFILFFIALVGASVGSQGNFALFMPGLFFIIGTLFLHLLKGYNKDGLVIKNKIEGFKLFLSTTEEDRIKVIGTPPTKTPQLYEKYLPYAIALGVEKQWSKKFASVFSELEEKGTPYIPMWYVGAGRFDRLDAGSFSSGLSRSLSSSSGSSNGGSGSGGGGGGGGSW